MDVVNSTLFNIMAVKGIVVNANSADDPNGNNYRVQVYIPSVQYDSDNKLFEIYDNYVNSTDKKNTEGYRKFPWASNTVANLKDGDEVYLINLNNENGSYVIIGADAKCLDNSNSNGIGGGSGELTPDNLAELAIPVIINNEVSAGTGPLYTDAWPDNIPLLVGKQRTYGNYNTNTSKNWTCGIAQWDGDRAYKLLVEIGKSDSNWDSYWTDKSTILYSMLKADIMNGADNSKNYNQGRTTNTETIASIRKMLESHAGQEVQRSQLRKDITKEIIWLQNDLGITNPALLIYLADAIHQHGYGINTEYEKIKGCLDVAKGINDNGKGTIEQLEEYYSWWIGHTSYVKSRRTNTYTYIKELYKQGKLSSGGLTMLGNLNQATYKGITLVWPFEDTLSDKEIVVTSGSIYSAVTKTPARYTITSLFGRRSFGIGKHSGVDFGCPRGTELYASHDGTLTIKDTGAGSYGYYAVISFTNGSDNWQIYYGHMIRGSAKQYGYETNKSYSIQAGQPIGLVNSTGNSTGNHLHYELRRNGSYVNPLPYLGMGNGHFPLPDGYLED